MEIFAHGLWTGVAALAFNEKSKKRKIRVPRAVFWGVFPDLFAFTAIGFWYAFKALGDDHFRDLPEPLLREPIGPNSLFILNLTSFFYSAAHSIVVFVLVLAIVYLMRRRLPLEMFGWAFHIFVDFFTHGYHAYPTPILWPVSEWRFATIDWNESWFLILNYFALFVAYSYLITHEHIAKMKAVAVKYREVHSHLRTRLRLRREAARD